MAAAPPLSLKDARAALGVAAQATSGELRRAFREAAKLAHPDRPGGDAERFRLVVEAYHRLSAPPPTSVFQPPAVRAANLPRLEIEPATACCGGVVSFTTAQGLVRISLPAGLRSGDLLRAGRLQLRVVVVGAAGLMVQGDDLWLRLEVDPAILAQGGRLTVRTPFGRRELVLSPAAAARGLVRIAGQGLPARGHHARGDLYLRLAASAERPADAATLLRRFADAWAA